MILMWSIVQDWRNDQIKDCREKEYGIQQSSIMSDDCLVTNYHMVERNFDYDIQYSFKLNTHWWDVFLADGDTARQVGILLHTVIDGDKTPNWSLSFLPLCSFP